MKKVFLYAGGINNDEKWFWSRGAEGAGQCDDSLGNKLSSDVLFLRPDKRMKNSCGMAYVPAGNWAKEYLDESVDHWLVYHFEWDRQSWKHSFLVIAKDEDVRAAEYAAYHPIGDGNAPVDESIIDGGKWGSVIAKAWKKDAPLTDKVFDSYRYSVAKVLDLLLSNKKVALVGENAVKVMQLALKLLPLSTANRLCFHTNLPPQLTVKEYYGGKDHTVFDVVCCTSEVAASIADAGFVKVDCDRNEYNSFSYQIFPEFFLTNVSASRMETLLEGVGDFNDSTRKRICEACRIEEMSLLVDDVKSGEDVSKVLKLYKDLSDDAKNGFSETMSKLAARAFFTPLFFEVKKEDRSVLTEHLRVAPSSSDSFKTVLWKRTENEIIEYINFIYKLKREKGVSLPAWDEYFFRFKNWEENGATTVLLNYLNDPRRFEYYLMNGSFDGISVSASSELFDAIKAKYTTFEKLAGLYGAKNAKIAESLPLDYIDKIFRPESISRAKLQIWVEVGDFLKQGQKLESRFSRLKKILELPVAKEKLKKIVYDFCNVEWHVLMKDSPQWLDSFVQFVELFEVKDIRTDVQYQNRVREFERIKENKDRAGKHFGLNSYRSNAIERLASYRSGYEPLTSGDKKDLGSRKKVEYLENLEKEYNKPFYIDPQKVDVTWQGFSRQGWWLTLLLGAIFLTLTCGLVIWAQSTDWIQWQYLFVHVPKNVFTLTRVLQFLPALAVFIIFTVYLIWGGKQSNKIAAGRATLLSLFAVVLPSLIFMAVSWYLYSIH